MKTGTLMCYQLTDNRERFERFQERVARQPELVWLEQKLGVFLPDFPEDANLDHLPTTPKCQVGALQRTCTLLSWIHQRGGVCSLSLALTQSACSTSAEFT